MKTAVYLINYAFREHSDMILFKTQLILIFLIQFYDKEFDGPLFPPLTVILTVKYQSTLSSLLDI